MHPDDVRKAYEELCNTYRAIDDFRGKLLGFLPFATGLGIFILVKDNVNLAKFAEPIGFVGMIITFGLYLFEIHGIAKCCELIEIGRRLECQRGLRGQFTGREPPRSDTCQTETQSFWNNFWEVRVFDVPTAAGVVYGAVMVSWFFLLLIGGKAQVDLPAGTVTLSVSQWVLALGLLVGMAVFPAEYARRVTNHFRKQADSQGTEPGDGESVRLTAFPSPVELVLCHECSKALVSAKQK
jgi:hypothetical protein